MNCRGPLAQGAGPQCAVSGTELERGSPRNLAPKSLCDPSGPFAEIWLFRMGMRDCEQLPCLGLVLCKVAESVRVLKCTDALARMHAGHPHRAQRIPRESPTMNNVSNSNNVSTSPNETTQQGVNVSTLPDSNSLGEAGLLVITEDNLTISFQENTEESDNSTNSEGVAPSTSNRVEARNDSESGDGDSGDTEGDTTALEDIAAAAGKALTSFLVASVGSSSGRLDPAQAVLNKYMKSDEAGASEPSPSSADGIPSVNFDSEAESWTPRANGLTESFAASMARFHADPFSSVNNVSLADLRGYELIKA